jgi:hypothetical protein
MFRTFKLDLMKLPICSITETPHLSDPLFVPCHVSMKSSHSALTDRPSEIIDELNELKPNIPSVPTPPLVILMPSLSDDCRNGCFRLFERCLHGGFCLPQRATRLPTSPQQAHADSTECDSCRNNGCYPLIHDAMMPHGRATHEPTCQV